MCIYRSGAPVRLVFCEPKPKHSLQRVVKSQASTDSADIGAKLEA